MCDLRVNGQEAHKEKKEEAIKKTEPEWEKEKKRKRYVLKWDI